MATVAPPSSRPAPAATPGRRGWGRSTAERLRRLVATTPDRLRTLRVAIVLLLLVVGTVVALGAVTTDRSIGEVADRIEPITADSASLYRSLAQADASLTSEFMVDGPVAPDVQRLYDNNVAAAAHSLADTEARSAAGTATTLRIGEIGALLPHYTWLAGVANQQGRSEGAQSLTAASTLMQSSMLPTAEAVQADQADQLDDAYRSASATPVVSIVLTVVGLLGLVAVQWFLFRWSRRVLSRGAVIATALVLVGGCWWAVAGMVADDHLTRSGDHARAITVALGPAQIAADQARAAENLTLVTRNLGGDETWGTEIELLDRDDGVGGALGAARALSTDPQGAADVDRALATARGYLAAHAAVVEAARTGRFDLATQEAVSTGPGSSTERFDTLDSALAVAVAHEQQAYGDQIAQARAWRTGLAVGLALLTVGACVAVGWGVHERLEEYR